VAFSYRPSAISYFIRFLLIVDCPLSLSVMTVIVNGWSSFLTADS